MSDLVPSVTFSHDEQSIVLDALVDLETAQRGALLAVHADRPRDARPFAENNVGWPPIAAWIARIEAAQDGEGGR